MLGIKARGIRCEPRYRTNVQNAYNVYHHIQSVNDNRVFTLFRASAAVTNSRGLQRRKLVEVTVTHATPAIHSSPAIHTIVYYLCSCHPDTRSSPAIHTIVYYLCSRHPDTRSSPDTRTIVYYLCSRHPATHTIVYYLCSCHPETRSSPATRTIVYYLCSRHPDTHSSPDTLTPSKNSK